MGGSSTPSAPDPKVTPFQQPAAPEKPIPNWFAGSGAGSSGAGSFTPDFSASKNPFGGAMPAPAVQPPAVHEAAPQSPLQSNALPSNGASMSQFSIPTMPLNNGFTGQNPFGSMAGVMSGFQNMFPPEIWNMLRPAMGAWRNAPRYMNYTDTNPALSTDAQGNQLGYPMGGNNTIWGFGPRFGG